MFLERKRLAELTLEAIELDREIMFDTLCPFKMPMQHPGADKIHIKCKGECQACYELDNGRYICLRLTGTEVLGILKWEPTAGKKGEE